MKFLGSPFHVIAQVLAFALLASCGGGGGGDPVVSASVSFPIAQALESYVKDTKSSPLSITASANSISFTGSGTLSESTTTTTFEGVTAFQKNSTLTGTLSGLGQTIPISSTNSSYFDSTFRPLGETDTDQYCVTTSITPIPATAKIGDNGNWFVYTCYTNSSKTLRLGTITVTYALEPKTATTGILKINNLFSADSGGGFTATATLRLTTAGALTRLSETAFISGLSITVTYQ
jgi:hypothetical protein